jgi:hypothetical protein
MKLQIFFNFTPFYFFNLSDLVSFFLLLFSLFLISFKITLVFQFHLLYLFLSFKFRPILFIVIYFIWDYNLGFFFYNFILHGLFSFKFDFRSFYCFFFGKFFELMFFSRFHNLKLDWLKIKLLD